MRADGQAFDLGGDRRGVLCLHGFTGTPFELRYLSQGLHARGFTVVAPLLPGHGETPAALDDTRWADWYAAAESALDALRARCDRVAIVGQSMGGALALHLARTRRDDVGAVATLAAPLWLPPAARLLIRAYRSTPLRRVLPQLPKPGAASDVRDPVMRHANPAYPVLPARALLELDELIRLVRRELPAITTPALVMHARSDHSVPFACSRELARRLGGRIVRHHTLYGSYHVLGIDIERDLVAREVGQFLELHLAPTARRTRRRAPG